MNDATPDGLQPPPADGSADEAPLLDEHFFRTARIRVNGKVIREATDTYTGRGRPPIGARSKVQQTLRLSPEVLEHFRATGDGWQARIDEALLDVVRAAATRDAA